MSHYAGMVIRSPSWQLVSDMKGFQLLIAFALLPFYGNHGAGQNSPLLRANLAQIDTPAPDPGWEIPPDDSIDEKTPPLEETSTTITQIFRVVFSADTLSEALSTVLSDAALSEINYMSDQTSEMTSLFSSILRPPESDYYAQIASSSIYTAAALAPALFLLRLGFYHWGRLSDDRDRLVRVLGDWLISGFLAVASGEFLDLLVQIGWWMSSASLGETYQLAKSFVSAVSVTDALRSLLTPGKSSMFAAIFAIGGGLGGLLGVVGLAFTFAAAKAALFVMSVLGPLVFVVAVIPQMKWLRGLWLKAVAILALMPVAAGGIFKATIALATYFGGSGLADLLIRLLWLWGAVGFMLSLAGILGRVTLTAAVDAGGKLLDSTRSVITTAATVFGGLNGGAAVTMSSATFSSPGQAQIAEHAVSGSSFTTSGLKASRLTDAAPDYGFSGGANQKIFETSHHQVAAFNLGFSQLSAHMHSAQISPKWLAETYPVDTARMVDAYLNNPGTIESASDPLFEAARIGGANDILRFIEGNRSEQGF